MLKYVRIAVTALSLTACVFLIALWVRSFQPMDWINICGYGLLPSEGVLGVHKAWLPPGESEIVYLGGDSAVFLPIGWLNAATIVTGCTPWIHRRFSLRTLLIATTLVAVVLGVIVATR